jgi:hypothetical protein
MYDNKKDFFQGTPLQLFLGLIDFEKKSLAAHSRKKISR